MKCPYCGHENDNSALVCVRCKAELPVKSADGAKTKPVKAKKSEE